MADVTDEFGNAPNVALGFSDPRPSSRKVYLDATT
jgi:hypothetical protein